MHRCAVALATLLLRLSHPPPRSAPAQYQLQSPDGATQITVEVGDAVDLLRHAPRPDRCSPPRRSRSRWRGDACSATERVRSEARRQVRDSVRPVAPTKSAVVRGPVQRAAAALRRLRPGAARVRRGRRLPMGARHRRQRTIVASRRRSRSPARRKRSSASTRRS
jgi:hypothetical protein